MLMASLSPSAVMIELCLAFGGIERTKQARPVLESGSFHRRLVFQQLTAIDSFRTGNGLDFAFCGLEEQRTSFSSSMSR